MAEKNKFRLTGQYKGSAANEIDLGAYNIAPGSVVVTAGGVTLVENTDYIVDYNGGRVTIINQSIIDAGTPVSASVESNDTYGMQRKTLRGIQRRLPGEQGPDYRRHLPVPLGTAADHQGEHGQRGPEQHPLGMHLSWKHKAQWLTNWLDAIPFVNATQPSRINFDAQVAQLVAGQSGTAQGGASYR